MGFFSNFLSPGKSQITNANAQASRFLERGETAALNETNAAEKAQLGYLSPYTKAGTKGFELYNDAIGVNGADGYGRAFETFNADPFAAGEQDATDLALRNTFRAYNAGGMGNSGASRLGVGRVAAERYGGRVADFRNRLAGAGQQGYDASARSAGIVGDAGRYRADTRFGVKQQRAGNAINFGNAMAASKSAGINNLFRLGGLAMQGVGAAMGVPPLATGAAAAGGAAAGGGLPNMNYLNQHTGMIGGGV